MKLKEFADLCMGDYLPAKVKDRDYNIIVRVNHLKDIKNLNIANRDVLMFNAYYDHDDGIYWLIIVEK